ncbi:MAG: ATP-binding protein [Nitrospirae bacterium]|nr:MAG: ATP-binding protein [Nitrospirota bacterium]
MIRRVAAETTVRRLLARNRVVAILGARQVGKTTLAGQIAARWQRGPVTRFDLEDPRDLAALEEPSLALRPLKGLVVLDEIQRRPDLFPLLRVLVDRRRPATRFLVLGSASPDLLRQSSETLAGRIQYFELRGFSLAEVGERHLERLWLRGGFPRAYLARSDRESAEWRRGFVRTFLERDVPQLGIRIGAQTLQRFWAMLAHYHGQVWNASEFARSFGVSDTTVRRYLDLLTATFLVRQLRPWVANLGKRQVKSPKIYFTDSGLLHTLLQVDTLRDLLAHPRLGASWEGFALAAVIDHTGARPEECHFWRTHTGAELDLLLVRGRRLLGFEFKRTDAPRRTPSMARAVEDLGLGHLYLVHAGDRTFRLGPRITAVPLSRLRAEVPRLP